MNKTNLEETLKNEMSTSVCSGVRRFPTLWIFSLLPYMCMTRKEAMYIKFKPSNYGQGITIRTNLNAPQICLGGTGTYLPLDKRIKHSNSFDSHTKCIAGVFLTVDITVFKHIGIYHSAT